MPKSKSHERISAYLKAQAVVNAATMIEYFKIEKSPSGYFTIDINNEVT